MVFAFSDFFRSVPQSQDRRIVCYVPPVVDRPAHSQPDFYGFAAKHLFRYTATGHIELEVTNLKGFAKELIRSDAEAKWDFFMRKRSATRYVRAVSWAVAPFLLPFLTKSWVKRIGAIIALLPVCTLGSYLALPRESISTFRLKKEARGHMEEESEATDLLDVKAAKEIKDSAGADLLTGSRLTKVVASTGLRRRSPYAAKIAQVARAKVGYLKNTPENRLIYQRVLLEIMDKDCVRYVDRDFILPLAIGCCFVYPQGVEEASCLWASTESLGVK